MGDTPTYSIKDWAAHYEKNHKPSEVVFRWVAMPTKHDGKSYRRLTRHHKAVEVFCAWALIMQVAAKCPNRGTLADENGPLTAIDLSDETGFPAEIFELAFKVLAEKQIGWIVVDGGSDKSGVIPTTSEQLPPTVQNNTKQNNTSPQPPAVGGILASLPPTEAQGESPADGERTPKRRAKFNPPTVDEAVAYAREISLSEADSRACHDFYLSKGWVVGKSPMKDWRACWRTWKRNSRGLERFATGTSPVLNFIATDRRRFQDEQETLASAAIEAANAKARQGAVR